MQSPSAENRRKAVVILNIMASNMPKGFLEVVDAYVQVMHLQRLASGGCPCLGFIVSGIV